MSTTIELTDQGQKVARAIATGHISWFDWGLVAESGIWGDCLSDEVQGICQVPASSTGGIINGMIQAGFFNGEHGDDGSWIVLTEAGAAYCLAIEAEAAQTC